MTQYINYPRILDEAMHSALKKIVSIISENGPDESCSFFISFLTDFAGVTLSNRIRRKYPEEITIVLQHQFDNLIVQDDYFQVDLSFDAIKETVVVPYAAITSFKDTVAKFAIEFDPLEKNLNDFLSPNIEEEDDVIDQEIIKDSKNLILLDQYRKKKKK